jgi:glycosyltransferase involved in cell wall biosynthesis
MRLLVLDQFSELGGAQRCLLDLLPAMAARRWKALVGLPGKGEMFAHVREIGFDAEAIECGPYESGRKSVGDLVRFGRTTPRLVGQIRRLTAQIGAEVVYVNGPRLLPATALAHAGRPVVFHSHSYIAPGVARRLAGEALRRMDARVIGQSHYVAEPWEPFVGRDRIRVIYNGVATPREMIRRTAGSPPRVGCIGRIGPEKGQLEFVEVARTVLRSVPECRFVVHGAALFGGADYEARVREAAAGLPVEFAGWTSDVYAAMRELDLLLVPSTKVEATTRVILEAFAAGLPVIAFGVGGIPEVVEDSVDGVLVRSTEEMARAAIGLLGDPARRAGIVAAARETWTRRFALERFRREVLEQLRGYEKTCPEESRHGGPEGSRYRR